MQALATTADLTIRNLPGSVAGLEAASAAVRDAAGAPISRETGTVTVMGTSRPWLLLPGPVQSVSAVTIDGEPVTDYQSWPHGLFRLNGWESCGGPAVVKVTMTYGFDPVPADIVALVCDLAALDSTGPTDPRLKTVTVDDATITNADAAMSVMQLPARTREALRARFSGGLSAVTGR